MENYSDFCKDNRKAVNAHYKETLHLHITMSRYFFNAVQSLSKMKPYRTG